MINTTEILRDLCKYREIGGSGVPYCFNRIYDSVEECKCQCIQDIFYICEKDNEADDE